MSGPAILLVVGIHRQELAFGKAVAAGLDPTRFDVLAIEDGLSGCRPRQDQRFHYDTLHRALYLQLLRHVESRHRLLIDLHTGVDPAGPCADIYSRDTARLAACLAHEPASDPSPRLVALVRNGNGPSAQTVIPREIWDNPRFQYLGVEIYLPGAGEGSASDQAYARSLIEKIGQCR